MTTWLASALLLLAPLAAVLGCSAEEDEGYTDAMAREHAGDVPVAAAAADVGAEPAPTGESVVYGRSNGQEFRGFVARPEGAAAGAPGLLVIHEWWGLNENIRTMTRRLAAEGYVALAVDLYDGGVAQDPEGARSLMQQAMADPGRALANLRAAHAYLEGELSAARTGVIGWCFGGGWSLEAALQLDELDAAVMYYGRVVTDRERLAGLDAPILGLFAGEDQGIPVAQVRAFEGALRELGKPASVHVYPGAHHAFANPSGTRYDAEAARDAWAKTLEFFARNLSEPGSG